MSDFSSQGEPEPASRRADRRKRRPVKLTGPVTLIIVGGSMYLLVFGALIASFVFAQTSVRYEITLVMVSVAAMTVIAGLYWLLDQRTAKRQMVGRQLAEAMHERRDRAEERVEETQTAIAGELVTIHAMDTAIYNATGSLPEIKRLLMANEAALAGLKEGQEEILNALAASVVEGLAVKVNGNGKVSPIRPRS